jgi:trk system potassium uptake protein TrkH
MMKGMQKMDISFVRRVMGNLLVVLSLSMLPSLGWSIYYMEGDSTAFLFSITITLLCGIVLRYKSTRKKEFGIKEAFLTVALGWILAGVFGALPFVFFGAVGSFTDGFFEAVSGFTTTGATVINDLEVIPHGILFWRSFTHWLGGMGIIVLFLAILPQTGASGIYLFKAEVPGPSVDKISSRMTHTAKILWLIYLGITVVQTLLLMVSGMNLFDSLTHTFGTVATGGFSTKNQSVGAFYNPISEIIIILFMLISGINFNLHYQLIKGQWRKLFSDEEFKYYIGTFLISSILIAINLKSVFVSFFDLLRTSSFQVASIMTTTGFCTANFDEWPDFSRLLLLLLMFFGGCAGSTAGAIKHIRFLTMFKYCYRELIKMLHPKAVIPVKINGKPVPDDVIRGIAGFCFLYIALFLVGSLFLLLLNIDMLTAVSAVAASLGNIGPGFALVGPYYTYAQFPHMAKLVLSVLMLLGRLELFTIIVCFMPEFWYGARFGRRRAAQFNQPK